MNNDIVWPRNALLSTLYVCFGLVWHLKLTLDIKEDASY